MDNTILWVYSRKSTTRKQPITSGCMQGSFLQVYSRAATNDHRQIPLEINGPRKFMIQRQIYKPGAVPVVYIRCNQSTKITEVQEFK